MGSPRSGRLPRGRVRSLTAPPARAHDPRKPHTSGGHAMELGLKGKQAIVTGGSLGIGKAIARELAREGVDVAIVARTKDQLEATARELPAETAPRIIPLVADVTSRTQVDAMTAQAAAQLGG